MSIGEKLHIYLEDKLGKDDAAGFEMWAFVGMKPNKTKDLASPIDKWNSAHPTSCIKSSMNTFDAVDRMIEIWKERFS